MTTGHARRIVVAEARISSSRRTKPAAPQRHRPKIGRRWIAVSLGLIAVAATSSAVAGALGEGSSSVATTAAFAFVAVSLAAAIAATKLRHRGRKLAAPDAQSVLGRAADAGELPTTARPVVYLRSFDRDETPYTPHPFSRRHRRVFTLGSLLFGAAARQPQTHEERLARALKPVGPFIAIGDPRDQLPDLGAARLYVDDGDWQSAIVDLIERAELVVIETEESEGLVWEVEQVVRRVPPERLLLSFPVTKGAVPRRDRYEAFRERTSGIFPKALPADCGDGQFIVFDEDWTPSTFAPTRSANGAVAVSGGPASQQLALRRLRDEFRLHTVRFALRMIPYALLLAFAALIVVVLVVEG